MKIVFLISSLRGGGAERVASTLCNHWANNGQQIVMITMDDAENDFYQSNKAITRYSINAYKSSNNILSKIWSNISRLLKIRQIIKQHQPDVVVSFMDVSNMIAILACIGTGIPVVISERTYPPYYNHNNLFDLLRKNIYKLSSAFVAQTSNVASWAREFLINKPITVIANPLDNNGLLADLDQPRANNIIAVGRLCPEKGFDLLITAFSKCQVAYPDWSLLIIGEGPERKNLEQQIQDLGLTARVKLMGQIAAPQTYYASSKIYVLSSRVEGFPNVLLEAMAHELAVISFDCTSGPADIISNKINGLLVPAQDEQQLLEAMQLLLQDEQLRTKLSKQAIKVRDVFNINIISVQWLKIFELAAHRSA